MPVRDILKSTFTQTQTQTHTHTHTHTHTYTQWMLHSCCCNSYDVTKNSNTIRIQLQMIQYLIWIKILSKDTPSFQRRDWLKKWQRKWGWNTLEYDQNQICWMWMRWTMIYKTNEIEINDEKNELDFVIRNEWDESD